MTLTTISVDPGPCSSEETDLACTRLASSCMAAEPRSYSSRVTLSNVHCYWHIDLHLQPCCLAPGFNLKP